MAPEQSVIFAPEMDERQLDREVSQVDEQLQEVGQGVPVDFDEQGMDGLGMPEGGLDGMGGGGGGLGPGAGAGATGLASKLPKPVAGVSVASAVPVALAGGVGLGMLAAMQGASARLQTSASILGSAWNAIWRPLGNKFDKLFIRDVVTDIRDEAFDFGNAIREGDFLDIGISGVELADELVQGAIDLGSFVNPLLWSSVLGDNLGGDLVGAVSDALPTITTGDVVGAIGWPTVAAGGIIGSVDWPSIATNSLLNAPSWPTIGAGAVVGAIRWPSITADMLVNALTGFGGGSPDGTPATSDDIRFDARGTRDHPTPVPQNGGNGGSILPLGGFGVDIPGFQAGGRVSRTGVAEVHRGELIADPDRLVDDLASAIGDAGGGGATTDTTAIEDKLDRLHSDMKRLEEALDVSFVVNGEEIGRAASEGKRHKIADRDPRVG